MIFDVFTWVSTCLSETTRDHMIVRKSKRKDTPMCRTQATAAMEQ